MALEWKKLALLQYALNPSGDPTALGLDADGDLQVVDDEAQALLQRVVDAVGEDSGSTLNSLLTVLSQVDFATSAKQLADNHNVTVSNPITGFATAANQVAAQAVYDRIIATLGEVSGATVIEVLQSIDTELADQQKDALTDSELRASPVSVDTGLTQPTTPSDTQPVSVSNQIDAQIQSEYLFSEYESSLADGAEIVSPILDMQGVDKWQGEFGAGVAGLTQVIETSNDAALSEFTITSTTVIDNTFQLFNVIVRQRYLRIRWQNNTGSPASGCYAAIKASYGSSDKLSVFPLAVEPTDFSQAALVQAVGKGQQPDGDYVNTPADGNIYSHGTPLGASGSFTAGAFDTDGWKAIELYVATDQVSLQDGIVVEYTDDAQAVSPTWYPGPKFTFGQDAVDAGFLVKRFAPALDGFRVTYTNGGFAQTSFYFSLELKNGVTEPTSVSIENDIDPSTSAQLMRGVDVAINDSGVYGNIERGPLGGKRVSIYEHEAETPIKPLNNLSGNASSVSSATPTQIAAAPPAGTKSVEIQADPDNTKVVYLGFNSGLTSGNAPVALQAGDARVYEVEGTPLFYALGSSGSQSVRWTYIAEV